MHEYLVKIRQSVHEISCKQALFGLNLTVLVPQWPWKSGQGHQNLISSLSCPNVMSMQIWLKSGNRFMRYRGNKKVSRQRRHQRDPYRNNMSPPFRWGDIMTESRTCWKQYTNWTCGMSLSTFVCLCVGVVGYKHMQPGLVIIITVIFHFMSNHRQQNQPQYNMICPCGTPKNNFVNFTQGIPDWVIFFLSWELFPSPVWLLILVIPLVAQVLPTKGESEYWCFNFLLAFRVKLGSYCPKGFKVVSGTCLCREDV